MKQPQFCVLAWPIVVLGLSLALQPKSEIYEGAPNIMLYYCGLETSNSQNILGKYYYKAIISEGNYGHLVVSIRSRFNGYNRYKGYYPNGSLKEEGELFVLYTGGLPGIPFPDRHDVWNGKYYKPDGTLGATVSNGTGTQKLWFPNGNLSWELELVDGRRVRCKDFAEDGRILANVRYVDGKEVYLKVD